MYNYEQEKEFIFTDEGQRLFIQARDRVQNLLEQAGAFTMSKPLEGLHCPDSWRKRALIDRMVEIGDIQEITGIKVAGQHRVFVSARN